MSSSIDQMTEIYVFVDDFLKANPLLAHWRTSNYSQPPFSDSEVITIALMQGCFGVATLKQTYRLVSRNYKSAFPLICSYQQWIRRLHRLTNIVGHLFSAARRHDRLSLYLIDSKPIAECKPIRHCRVRNLREDGAYFGKSSCGWYFGFKLHLLRNIEGAIEGGILTPANTDDRDPALALLLLVDGGIVLADLGYRGEEIAELVAEEAEMLIITRADAPEAAELISTVRQRIETTFSQLWNRFIDRVFSRSWLGLWNTIKLKMLHYNLCHSGILSA